MRIPIYRMARAIGVGLSAALAWAVPHAAGWTYPVNIAGTSSTNAHIARGADGGLHVCWYGNWRIMYRHRDANGNWGAIETLSTFFSHRNDIIEDAQGTPHVFFAGDGANAKADLWHCWKSGGVWQMANLTNSSDYDEDEPRVAMDSLGHLHLIYTKSSGGNSIVYRMWNGSTWSGETWISSGGGSYYQRPDISISPNDNIHVVNGTTTALVYVKYNGSSWSSPVNISTGWGYLSYPRVAAVSNTQVVALANDQNPGGLRYTVSNDGGATWSPRQFLVDGQWPNMEACNGNAHLVFSWGSVDPDVVAYMRWTGSGWTSVQAVSPVGVFQAWADVTADVTGVAHVVYDDGQVWFVSNMTDVTPPAPVTQFTATPVQGAVGLSLRLPSDLDTVGAVIRYKTTGYPTGPSDGTLLANLIGSPDASVTTTHSGVMNGTTYYYAAFAYDHAGNYSSGATVSATPFVRPDLDRDGDVDVEDFGLLQRCLSGEFVVQTDPGCQAALFDGDTDVDQADVDIFVNCLRGPNVPYVPTCANAN